MKKRMKKRMNKKRKKGGGQKEPRRGTEVPLLRNTTHKGAWARSTQSINSNAQFPPPKAPAHQHRRGLLKNIQNKILDLQSNHRFGNNQIENLERKTGETRIGEFELKSRKPWRTRKRVEERGRGRVCGVLLTGAAGVFDSNVVAWLVFWFGLV